MAGKCAKDGVTQKELDIAKTTLTGSYRVGFDTTGGLASGILSAVVDWGDLSYVDTQPEKINAITLEQDEAELKALMEGRTESPTEEESTEKKEADTEAKEETLSAEEKSFKKWAKISAVLTFMYAIAMELLMLVVLQTNFI